MSRSLLSRRRLLQIGGMGLAGLCLPQLLRAQERRAAGTTASADACILIYLNGGPSHLDMWDMKPEAPEAFRGEFKPIATTAPGVQLSEHLPRLARQMHRCALIRSMHHSVNNSHAAAVYAALTGHDRGEKGGGARPDDNPAIGSVLSRLRPGPAEIVPYVSLPYVTKEGAGGPPQPGFFGGWLGRSYDPLFVLKDPNAADFCVPEVSLLAGVSAERLARRGRLLDQVGLQLGSQAGQRAVDALDRFQRRAVDLLLSDRTQRAFRIADEPDRLRDAYGRNIYGQSVLLARRLIEAGTRMVTLSWAPDANATWDTHGGNFKKLKGSLLPQFDAACAGLLSDLHDRGILDRTLVAVLGDFGRTPKINNSDGGRDHWNHCYTVMLAGGGVRGGFVRGASDKTGAFPAGNPTTPGDVISTMYHLLGVPPRTELPDALNRPFPVVPEGSILQDLIA
jgi:hypothetical protein